MEPVSPIVAVGAIVVRDGALLMVQRDKEPARGLWTIPGGRVERGEYLADAVRREVGEETGVDVSVGGLVGIFEVVPGASGDEHYVILDYAATPTAAAALAARGDAADARWVPLDEVERLPCTPRLIETLSTWGVLGDGASADEEPD